MSTSRTDGSAFQSWGETCPELVEGYAARRFDRLSERVRPQTERHPIDDQRETLDASLSAVILHQWSCRLAYSAYRRRHSTGARCGSRGQRRHLGSSPKWRSFCARPIAWEAQPDQAWLQISPDRGTTPAEVTVSLAAGLPPGLHAANIRLTKADLPGQSATVAVTAEGAPLSLYLPLIIAGEANMSVATEVGPK